MSKQTAANFFILSPSEANSAELYQALLRGIESYQQLGQRLIRLAEQAHAFRQFDKVNEMAMMLSNLPIKTYQAIGHYFLALATHRVANGDTDVARRLFELAVDTAPDAYKLKATLALGSIAIRRKDFDSAIRCFQETTRTGNLSVASLQAIRGISILKAMEGSHTQAVKDMESILPVIKYAPAHVYFDLLNSYAVELGEVGRKDEARNIMQVVLTSPFAFAYPEWRETAEELRQARRSFVTIGSSHYNVLAMPEREPSEQPTIQPKPARVLSFAKWKKKMDKKSKDKQIEKSLDEMSFKDLGFKLLELITTNQADEHQMRIILTFVMQVFSEPVKPPDKPSA
jgi:tetratricopeptide (TPR) repeat protein